MNKFGPGVWAVGGGATDLEAFHLVFQSLLYSRRLPKTYPLLERETGFRKAEVYEAS